MRLIGMIFATLAVVSSASIKGPPHVTSDVDTKQLVHVGDLVRLQCPIQGHPDPIIEWYKDDEAITPGWIRFRASGRSLRIKNVERDDSGTYVCKGINGFGSREVNIELFVVDPSILGSVENIHPRRGQHHGENGDGQAEAASSAAALGSKPTFVHYSRFDDSDGTSDEILRPGGATITFRCIAEGIPPPQIKWTKDGEELTTSAMVTTSNEGRRGRSVLHLTSLRAEDSGKYACDAKNMFGNAIYYFPLLSVIERVSRRPDLELDRPGNVSVRHGQKASLRCSVRSEVVPLVQWLKRVPAEQASENDVIQVDGVHFRRVESSGTAEIGGVYIDKLVFPSARASDGGTYVCLASNTIGYNYKETVLRVVTVSDENGGDVTSRIYVGDTALLYMAVPVVFVIAAAATGVCFLRRRRKASQGADRRVEQPALEVTPLPPRSPNAACEKYYCARLANYVGTAVDNGTQTPEAFPPSTGEPYYYYYPSSPEYAYPEEVARDTGSYQREQLLHDDLKYATSTGSSSYEPQAYCPRYPSRTHQFIC